MKFTRLPDQPKARPAPSRKLPPLKRIRSVQAPDERAEAFLSMTFGLLATVLFGGLTLLIATSSWGSSYVGIGIMALMAYLVFGIATLMSFWHFLKGAFRYLAAEPGNKR